MAKLRRWALVLRASIALIVLVIVLFALRSAYGWYAGRRLSVATLRAEQTWLARPALARDAPDDKRAGALAEAATALALSGSDLQLLKRVTRFDKPESFPDEAEALAGVLARNEAAFERLERAEVRAGSAGEASAEYPNVVGLLQLGRLVAAKAALAVHHRDLARATAVLEQGYQVSGSLAGEPDVLLQLIRAELDRMNHEVLRSLLRSGEPDAETLARLDRSVGGSSNRDGFVQGVIAELDRMHQLIVELENGDPRDSPGPRCPNGFLGWLVKPRMLDDHRASLAAMERIVAAMRRPPHQRGDHELRGRSAVRVECLALVELAYDTIASRADRAETRKLLAGTALALRRYRLRHGSYPATLAALSSAEPPASPIDPFTGRPLGFRRQGAGFVLRSAGVEPADRSLRWEIPR